MTKYLLFKLIAEDLNPYDFKLICVILYHMDDYEKMAVVSYDTLAEHMNIDVRNVKRNVKRILEKGYVRAIKRTNENNFRITNGYKVLI